MSGHQNEVEAIGEVGVVYTTRTGMEEADAEKQDAGWEQISPTKRVAVRSRDIGMHQRWLVWRKVK